MTSLEWLDNASNTLLGHLNIIPFRNKFAFFEDIIKLFDVFSVCKSKFNHTIPSNHLESNHTNFLNLTVIVLEVDYFCIQMKIFCANHYQKMFIFWIVKLLQLIKSGFCSVYINYQIRKQVTLCKTYV